MSPYPWQTADPREYPNACGVLSARVIADQLKKALGVAFVVQNIAGAGGGKGTAEAKRAKGDGYTLLMGSTGALTKPGYVTADFLPLAQLVEVPIGLAVASASPFSSARFSATFFSIEPTSSGIFFPNCL